MLLYLCKCQVSSKMLNHSGACFLKIVSNLNKNSYYAYNIEHAYYFFSGDTHIICITQKPFTSK